MRAKPLTLKDEGLRFRIVVGASGLGFGYCSLGPVPFQGAIGAYVCYGEV